MSLGQYSRMSFWRFAEVGRRQKPRVLSLPRWVMFSGPLADPVLSVSTSPRMPCPLAIAEGLCSASAVSEESWLPRHQALTFWTTFIDERLRLQ
jgi:hypothetical protein